MFNVHFYNPEAEMNKQQEIDLFRSEQPLACFEVKYKIYCCEK